MRDADCITFLQWALPKLRMRWPDFRRVRKQVCKRVTRRMTQLNLPGVPAYRTYLETHPEEWATLETLCRITISRFFRDRAVFDFLGREILPELARKAAAETNPEIRVWSVGCGAGEECYSLAILWQMLLQPAFPPCAFRILGADSDKHQLERARTACYPAGSLKEMPLDWRRAAFAERGGRFCLRPKFRTGVEFREQDVRRELPDGPFHLILCRNLVFTYFEEELQRKIALRLGERLTPGGTLVLGKHEVVPSGTPGLSELESHLRIYRTDPNRP